MHPPKLALQFLRFFCKEEYLEEIEGDILELYESRLKQSSKKAKILIYWDVIKSFRLINIREPKKHRWAEIQLIRNYYRIGFRFLKKDFGFSLINIAGLTLGLTAFFFMLMVVEHEYSFDKFHKKSDRIFEVIQTFQRPQGEDPEIYTSRNLAQTLKSEIAYVENAVALFSASSSWIQSRDQKFFETEGIIAGPEFFEIFDFELLRGKASDVLRNKRSIVISENFANRHFGTEAALGEIINSEIYGAFTVTGILKNLPTNSFIQFDFILTPDLEDFYETVHPNFPKWFNSWEGFPAATFVLLSSSEKKVHFSKDVEKVLASHIHENRPVNYHSLLNLRDLHFQSRGIDGQINNYVDGDESRIRFFGIIAISILFIAGFNYVNISISRSIRRSKEVGIRKSAGASGGQVFTQFMIESSLIIFISAVISIILIFVLQGSFREVSETSILVTTDTLLDTGIHLMVSLLLMIFLAGIYPATVLSKKKITVIFRDINARSNRRISLKNSLIAIQFTLVVIFSGVLLNIHNQYKFLTTTSMGFDTSQLLVVEINGGGVRDNFDQIKDRIQKTSGVVTVAGFTRIPGGYRGSANISVRKLKTEHSRTMRFYGTDENGISALDINLIQGRNFQGITSVDSGTVLVNQSAARFLGIEEIVGAEIELKEGENELIAQVIGVVEDFHYESLHDEIGPVVIGQLSNPFQSLDDIVIRINGNLSQNLSEIERIHNEYDRNDVLTWEFMDDMVQRAYDDERAFVKLLSWATAVSFLVAILGTVGLVSYSVISRKKEFGIRKVLGASIFQIMGLQGKGTISILIVSFLIAAPVGWKIADLWLENYAYRVEISTITFIGVLIFLIFISLLIIAVLGLGSAKENPVKSLRLE